MYNGVPISAVQQSDSVRHKKEQNNAICSNMDATRENHTKWRKSARERHLPYAITYPWNLKDGTNEPMYKAET